MTQDELAVSTGIDSSNVRGYEKGRAMPNIHTLVKIATALRIDAGWLLEDLTLDLFDGRVPGRRAG